jgi:hypothetical protein
MSETSVPDEAQPSPPPLLRGKVADILNERELVINIGRSAGVKRGMRFRVLAQSEKEVLDPDTRAPLGTVVQEKVRVRAIEVRERLAVARTYEVTSLASSTRQAAATRRAEGGRPTGETPEGEIRSVRTLRRDDSRAYSPLTPDDSYVEIGDPVEEVRPSTILERAQALVGDS